MEATALERASRALAANLADGESSPGQWFIEGGLYSDKMLQDIARAVLMAIREPSEEMLASFGIHKARVAQNWQAMIDAAITLPDNIEGDNSVD